MKDSQYARTLPRTVVAPNAGPFTLDGTRTYLVGRERVAIIDPGPPSDGHVERVAAEVADADETIIIVTHDHGDHSGAAPALSKRTGAPIRGAMDGVPLADDGSTFHTDAGRLRVVHTPGHASPHLSLYWLEEDALFVADLLLGRGETTWVGAYPGCVADYLASLDRVASIAPRILYPGHGPPIESPLETVERFRLHRLSRLEQLRELRMARPEAGAEELARRLYGMDADDPLQEAGLRSVNAMLHHLDTEAGSTRERAAGGGG